MPELPETIIIAKQMNRIISGKTIDSIEEFERFLSEVNIEATKAMVSEYLIEREKEREQRRLEFEEKNG